LITQTEVAATSTRI